MNKVLVFALLLIGLVSCSNPQLEEETNASPRSSAMEDSILKDYDFIDSTSLWPKERFILAIKSTMDRQLFIRVYQQSDSGLILRQSFDSLYTQCGITEPQFENFNADSHLDFKLHFASGGRGANGFDYVFLQDPNSHLLSFVKNSDIKPNLRFDKERQVITSTAYWAGTSFVDYYLNSDSLIPIEGVDVYFKPPHWTVREYYEYDSLGNQHTVRFDSVADDIDGLYTREK